MAQELSGLTAFAGATSDAQQFRFAVSVHEDKLTLWLEDRDSKLQWRTADLLQEDYANAQADTKIPGAKPCDYANRFAECLLAEVSTESAMQAKKQPYERMLYDVSKENGCRTLELTVRLTVGNDVVAEMVYLFTMMPVALSATDILEARVRDLTDELAKIKTSNTQQSLEMASLKLKLNDATKPATRATTELRTVDAAQRDQTLRWSTPYLKTFFSVVSNAQSIEVVRGGVYLVRLCLSHSSSNSSKQFELLVNGEVVRSLTDGSPGCGGGSAKQTFAPVNVTSYSRDSSFVVTAYIPAMAKVQVVYRGHGHVNASSSISLVEL